MHQSLDLVLARVIIDQPAQLAYLPPEPLVLLREFLTADPVLLLLRLQPGVGLAELLVGPGEHVEFDEGLLQVPVGDVEFIVELDGPGGLVLGGREGGHIALVLAEGRDWQHVLLL